MQCWSDECRNQVLMHVRGSLDQPDPWSFSTDSSSHVQCTIRWWRVQVYLHGMGGGPSAEFLPLSSSTLALDQTTNGPFLSAGHSSVAVQIQERTGTAEEISLYPNPFPEPECPTWGFSELHQLFFWHRAKYYHCSGWGSTQGKGTNVVCSLRRHSACSLSALGKAWDSLSTNPKCWTGLGYNSAILCLSNQMYDPLSLTDLTFRKVCIRLQPKDTVSF